MSGEEKITAQHRNTRNRGERTLYTAPAKPRTEKLAIMQRKSDKTHNTSILSAHMLLRWREWRGAGVAHLTITEREKEWKLTVQV